MCTCMHSLATGNSFIMHVARDICMATKFLWLLNLHVKQHGYANMVWLLISSFILRGMHVFCLICMRGVRHGPNLGCKKILNLEILESQIPKFTKN